MSHDIRLQRAVLDEFEWDPSLNAAHIGVTARSGVVTLTGHVVSFAEKHAAESATRRVKGVTGIAEEIEVRIPFNEERGDEELAAAAIARLGWDVSLVPNSVTVTVDKGWLTLTGMVDWHYQKDAAEEDVRRLIGVVGVSNQITIKPIIDTSSVSDNIMHALHRSWFFDPTTIKVTSDGGKIRLTGTVRTPHDRQIAAATAWTASGATSVENDIVVDPIRQTPVS
jgi:osmotically-inducible protein OsmY